MNRIELKKCEVLGCEKDGRFYWKTALLCGKHLIEQNERHNRELLDQKKEILEGLK